MKYNHNEIKDNHQTRNIFYNHISKYYNPALQPSFWDGNLPSTQNHLSKEPSFSLTMHPSLLTRGILLLSNNISRNPVRSRVHKHDHGQQSSPKQGKCHTAGKEISKLIPSWQRRNYSTGMGGVQSNQRVTLRLGVHAICNSLTDSLDTPKRSAVTDIL